MDDYSVSIKIMENGLENVSIARSSSVIINNNNNSNSNNNSNNNNSLSIKSSKKRRKSASMLDTKPNFLAVDYRSGGAFEGGFSSDTCPSPTSPTTPSPPTSQKSFKAKGGWAKIKRELIAKERNKENKDKHSESRDDFRSSTADMSPMNPPKSPGLGKKHADANNNNHYTSSSVFGSNFLLVEKKKTMKLLVLGQDGVGKSALIVRYLTRRYIGEYDPFLEGIFRKTILLSSQEILVEIKDTAKGINWAKRRNDLLWTDALVFMYSITNRNSFLEIQGYTKQIQQELKSRRVPCLIIGNKIDLAHVRKVDTIEGSKLANSLHGLFHEISVSDNYTDLERVLNNFIKLHCQGLKNPSASQLKMLSSRSSPEITREKSRDSTDGEHESGKSERKGRALWQKLRTNSELKKKK